MERTPITPPDPEETGIPDVTVSVVNTSQRDFTLACLAALEADESRYAVETVVLDNASDDDSVTAVAEAFPWARQIEQRRRAGFGANHNTVIRGSEGRYVYVLNEDATVDPGSFDRMVAYLDARPHVGALGTRVVYPGGRDQPSAWRFPTPAVQVLTALTLGRFGIVQSGGQEIRRVDWAMACALLVRREALERVGLFDEGFFLYCEETDLLLRMADAGYETHYLPSVIVTHHAKQSSAKVPERRIVEHWRSRHRYWAKHHAPLAARIAAVGAGVAWTARVVVAAAARRAKPLQRLYRPKDTDVAQFALNARFAFRGTTGPGIRELAEAWNAAHPDGPRQEQGAAGR